MTIHLENVCAAFPSAADYILQVSKLHSSVLTQKNTDTLARTARDTAGTTGSSQEYGLNYSLTLYLHGCLHPFKYHLLHTTACLLSHLGNRRPQRGRSLWFPQHHIQSTLTPAENTEKGLAYQAQHQDVAGWILYYYGGLWGSTHACWRGDTEADTVSAHSQCQAALLGSAQEWGNKEGGFGDLTLKMVQIFPQENHSRGCWYLLFHNALLHGNLSVPLSASILAVVRESNNAFLICWTRYLSLKYKLQKFTRLSWPQCYST